MVLCQQRPRGCGHSSSTALVAVVMIWLLHITPGVTTPVSPTSWFQLVVCFDQIDLGAWLALELCLKRCTWSVLPFCQTLVPLWPWHRPILGQRALWTWWVVVGSIALGFEAHGLLLNVIWSTKILRNPWNPGSLENCKMACLTF